VRVGRTSISTHVSVEAERESGQTLLTEAEVVYVAIDPLSPVRQTLSIRGDSSPPSAP
jgi:acyl-CoA hydrolase